MRNVLLGALALIGVGLSSGTAQAQRVIGQEPAAQPMEYLEQFYESPRSQSSRYDSSRYDGPRYDGPRDQAWRYREWRHREEEEHWRRHRQGHRWHEREEWREHRGW